MLNAYSKWSLLISMRVDCTPVIKCNIRTHMVVTIALENAFSAKSMFKTSFIRVIYLSDTIFENTLNLLMTLIYVYIFFYFYLSINIYTVFKFTVGLWNNLLR